MAKPTTPLPLPTTTSAVKLMSPPPLVTLHVRLTSMTRVSSALGLSSSSSFINSCSAAMRGFRRVPLSASVRRNRWRFFGDVLISSTSFSYSRSISGESLTGRKRSSIIEGRLADARPRAGSAAANPRGGERHSREEEARLARHLEPVAKVGFPGGAPIADAEGTLQRDAAAASRDARRRSADPTRNDLSIVSSLASAPTRGRGVAIELARPRCIPPPPPPAAKQSQGKSDVAQASTCARRFPETTSGRLHRLPLRLARGQPWSCDRPRDTDGAS